MPPLLLSWECGRRRCGSAGAGLLGSGFAVARPRRPWLFCGRTFQLTDQITLRDLVIGLAA